MEVVQFLSGAAADVLSMLGEEKEVGKKQENIADRQQWIQNDYTLISGYK